MSCICERSKKLLKGVFDDICRILTTVNGDKSTEAAKVLSGFWLLGCPWPTEYNWETYWNLVAMALFVAPGIPRCLDWRAAWDHVNFTVNSSSTCTEYAMQSGAFKLSGTSRVRNSYLFLYMFLLTLVLEGMHIYMDSFAWSSRQRQIVCHRESFVILPYAGKQKNTRIEVPWFE